MEKEKLIDRFNYSVIEVFKEIKSIKPLELTKIAPELMKTTSDLKVLHKKLGNLRMESLEKEYKMIVGRKPDKNLLRLVGSIPKTSKSHKEVVGEALVELGK